MNNNLNAPRMKKGKFSKSLITKDLFKEFKIKHPEYSEMTWDIFFGMWQDIAQTTREEVCSNPLGVKLGGFLGELKIQYLCYKPKIRSAAIPINLATKGKIPYVKWERRWASRFNKSLQLYAFEQTRELRDLATEHKKNSPEKIRSGRSIPRKANYWNL